MAKPFDALGIMNQMAGAAHKKSQKPKAGTEPDGDEAPSPSGAKKKFPSKKPGNPADKGGMPYKK